MELKRIVNIMPDEKFIDYYIEMSEKFLPDQSTYLFFKNDDEFKFVKSTNKNIIVIPRSTLNSESLLKGLMNTDKVVFHSFNDKLEDIINKLSTRTELVWLFWGLDGYSTQAKNKYIGRLTSKMRFDQNFNGYMKFAKNLLYNDFRIPKLGRTHRKIIKKMDYCATWVDNDFALIQEINPTIKRLYFNYYTDELMEFPIPRKNHSGVNALMLGNSGSEYNNHAEALIYLKGIGYDGIIYCPLSYGGSIRYKKNIEKLGKSLFDNNFVPLKTFMTLDKYQNIINSCDIVWMNHKRQQAAGNIFAAFCTGKIVILDPDNPMLPTFQKWGLKTYNKEVLQNKNIIDQDLYANIKVKKKLNFQANESFFLFLKQ